jgi:hypothetical protein
MHKFYFIIIALVCSQCKTIDTNQPTKETPTVSNSNTSFVDTPTSFSQWSKNPQIKRQWAGNDFWLNPLQSWKQEGGKIQNIVSGGDRNAVILTKELSTRDREGFRISVDVAFLQDFTNQDVSVNENLNDVGWVGIQLGLQGQFNDYRDDAIKGKGICAGITTKGELFVGNFSQTERPNTHEMRDVKTLVFEGFYDDNVYLLSVSLKNEGQELETFSVPVHESWITGLMALTVSQSIPKAFDYRLDRPEYDELPSLNKSVGGNTFASFQNLWIEGDRINNYPDRAFGPILWSQYSVSDQQVNISSQFVPLGNGDRQADLFIDGKFSQTASIDETGQNALFHLPNLDLSEDRKYEVRYMSSEGNEYRQAGIIRHNNPSNKLVQAVLSCVDDRGFPHQDLVNNVTSHNPDFISFHGDQLYERVGEYGVERNSKLDYLRKWYVFGWSFGELLRRTPSVIIPDDHDVFHGNLWGNGGKAADVSGGYGYDAQDSGGYKEPPDFVNMVHRTQTGYLPKSSDTDPIEQGITVYHTNINYRGVSFAVLADRMWKSAPKQFFPNAEIENGWPQNTSWDPKSEAFHPSAELLGQRQENFLKTWAANWSEGVIFKTVISQSPFCNIATLPADIWHDKYVPGLPRYRKGEYPEDDRPVADFDSNAWPQNKRDDALRIIRKSFSLHLTGDQHLGSTGRYGIDDYGDAGFWLATPAVANLWPRRWFPAEKSTSNTTDKRYSGDYEDGFGNKITVMGIANPYDIEREPAFVYDKAPGYSIITYEMETNEIELAVWPRWEGKLGQPFEDWPVRIHKLDNYGKTTTGYVGQYELEKESVVQVINDDTDEIIYTVRPNTNFFIPKVFDNSINYRVNIINGEGEMESFKVSQEQIKSQKR